MNKKKLAGAAFIDFSKAFDTVVSEARTNWDYFTIKCMDKELTD